MTHRFVPGLLVLLATGLVLAQDGGSLPLVRGGSGAAGEYMGPRPPEGANQEERRAFWQKQAAERTKTEKNGAPVAGQAATPAQVGGQPEEIKLDSGRSSEARDGKPATPVFEHQHGGVSDRAASSKPEESARGGSRPSGMGMRGGGVIWLSDSPPMRGDGTRPAGSRGGGMGGMAMGGERSGPPTKRLWLRSGADPQKSSFYREDADAVSEMLLVTPQGKPEGEALPLAAEGNRNLSFEMPVQGFYRFYVTTRKLQGDTLNVSVAKAEIANFGHGGDEEEQARAMLTPRFLESALIEIVRERQPGEKQFFQLKSGDEQAYVVLQKGLPLQGSRVRFVSHDGWSKEAVSDEQGRVVFQVVRDYFPPWAEFQRRFKASYLVIAEANAAETGHHLDQPYNSIRYQATLAGSYYPSPDDYRSYAWGLGIGLPVVLFCGVSVYLYRRRRVKPFQEVRFDESK